jgi:energy-coupling factor transporter ATP-binding protein EcfA2
MVNFRGFEDETVSFESHTCLVGPNGAGKSTVLAALNVFFQESSSATEVTTLTKEDFHGGNTDAPVEITVTFGDLSSAAKESLDHYVRHDELLVTAIARFDPYTSNAPVQQFGERLIFKQFAPFFEEDKNKTGVDALRLRFAEVIAGLGDFPSLGSKPTKVAMIAALRKYEEERPQLCVQERSNDQFYGSTRGKGKLEPFVQWVYLPAVKDASEEAEEAGNTALGKLLQRTVRQKVSFDDALEALRLKTRTEYDELLAKEQGTLNEISTNLAKRLAVFAHPDAGLAVEWQQGSEKSVSIGDPRATIKAQEGIFKGSLVRFGHGLQRSFLLAILQELASTESAVDGNQKAERPTLILGCEEPELYQHPPQARHLSTELRALADVGNQIILTTHSAYFVSGESFDEIRLIRKDTTSGKCFVKFTNFVRYSDRIAAVTGKKPDKPPVARAKLLAALRPEPSELFFCQRLVLVEGIADRAYVSGALHLDGKWNAMRRAGLHIIPVDGKSSILQLLTIAQELAIPCFVIFDADGDEKREIQRGHHERDNKALFASLGIKGDVFPTTIQWGDHYAVWPNRIEVEVTSCFEPTDWQRIGNEARQAIDPGASLSKNPVLIGEILSLAWKENKKPKVLLDLSDRLLKFAGMQEVVA